LYILLYLYSVCYVYGMILIWTW